MTRLATSLTVALVAALVAGSTLAAVSADTKDAATAADWTIPMGALGDRGTYHVDRIFTTSDGERSDDNNTLDFAWTADTALDAWANEVVVDRLDTVQYAEGIPQDMWFRDVRTFLPGESLILSYNDAGSYAMDWSGFSLLGGTTSQHLSDSYAITVWGMGARDCYFGSPFHDLPLEDGATVDLGMCQHESPAFKVTHTDQKIVLDDGAHRVFVFQPGIPYPMAVQDSFHVEIQGDDTMPSFSFELEETWTLVGYTPGDTPRKALEQRQPAPAMDTSPLTSSILDDAGLDHPFPLSKAYKAATTDLQYTAFADFLRTRPEAYLASASYQTWENEGHKVQQWHLTAAEGSSFVDVVVNQTHQPNTGGLPREVRDAAALVTVAPEARGEYGRAGQYPPRSTLPNRLPTAPVLLERWATFTGEPGEAYGFGAICADANCTAGLIVLTAGDTSVLQADSLAIDSYPVGITAMETKMRLSFLVMGQDGAAWTLLQMKSDITNGAQGSTDAPVASPTPVPTKPILAGLVPIGPKAASGAGALGILAGLLYYFWPALKSGAVFGLFSRVESSAVAQHPMRRRILDAVAAEPGIHHNALCRKTDIGSGAMFHHVGKLTAAGELVMRSDGHYRCYFLPATSKADVARGLTVRSDGAQAVLDAVLASPGATAPEVAQSCGIRLSTAQYHMGKLAAAGLLHPVRDRRVVRFHPAAAS